MRASATLVVAERAGLLQQHVDQGGLAMVDMRDDGDVTQFHEWAPKDIAGPNWRPAACLDLNFRIGCSRFLPGRIWRLYTRSPGIVQCSGSSAH
jgi:hypothetical protein